jgi:hypothetical protein
LFGTGGGTLTNNAATGTFTESAAAGQFTSSTNVTLGYDPASSLAAPLLRAPHLLRSGRIEPMFTPGAGNTYVVALCTSFVGALTGSLSLSGAGGIVPSSVATGTQLNIAIFQGGTWVDVGTAVVNGAGTFQSSNPTVSLPGIATSGTYLVYVPAPGTNNTQLDLGIALLADDSSAASSNGLQLVQVEGPTGIALASPTTQYFPLTGLDLDGESLSPDASQGAVVDGGNNVYFFSGVAQHTFTLSSSSVNINSYGGDGDSIASLPGGDEVVVSGDNGAPLAVIGGIIAGTPAVVDTVSTNGAGRDGLVLSADGKVLLTRGGSVGPAGIDVYSIAKVAPHAGSIGVGTTSFNFTLTKSFVSGLPGDIVEPYLEDGRDGMAISPRDSSRAVIIGHDVTEVPTIQLLTGLTGSSPVVSTLRLRVPYAKRRLGNFHEAPEPSAHRRPFAITPSAGSELLAVTISPDGTTAYVATDVGIITVSGVNTGNLAQVGSVYAPTITYPNGSCSLSGVSTISVLPDGKYLIAVTSEAYGTCTPSYGSTSTSQGNGILVTVPIGPGGVLGAPVGQLTHVVSPYNDQMISH